MPKYIFKDTHDAFELLPKGKYWFKVVGATTGLQEGNGKTRGCDFLNLKLAIPDNEGNVRSTIKKKLIFHEDCEWMIEDFIKATAFGEGVEAGHEIELEPRSVVGLRGRIDVDVRSFNKNEGGGIDPVTGKPKTPEVIEVNEIVRFIRTNEPLARDMGELEKYDVAQANAHARASAPAPAQAPAQYAPTPLPARATQPTQEDLPSAEELNQAFPEPESAQPNKPNPTSGGCPF